MRLLTLKYFWVGLLAALFLIPLEVWAQKKTPTVPPAEVKKEQPPKEKPPEVPNLGKLILQANELANRLAVLEAKIAQRVDLHAVEKSLQELEARLAPYPAEIKRLKASPRINYDKIVAWRDTLRLNAENLEDLIAPLTRATTNLGKARKEWLAERKRWNKWQAVLITDETLPEVKTGLAGAQKTIDSALISINQQLQPLLALLQKSGRVDSTINRSIAELDGLTQARRKALLGDETAPIFSLRYFSQLKNLTWVEVGRGVQAIAWPKPEFYKNLGWILVLQIFTALAVILMILRHRSRLMESERWRFLAKRPIAAGLFIGVYLFFPLMGALPAFIYLLLWGVGGLGAIRLIGGLVEKNWQRLLLYTLAFFLFLYQFFRFINLPQPLIQLYVFIVALVGLGLCYWRATVRSREDSPLTTWLFWLGGIFFLGVLVAEAFFRVYTAYFLAGVLDAVVWILLGWLMIYLACGGVEGLVQSALLQRFTLVRENTEGIIRGLARLVKVIISLLVLGMILMDLRVYTNPLAAVTGILSWGVTIGTRKITLGLLFTAAAFLYGSLVLSWVLQSLVMEDKTTKEKMGPGGQQSVATLIHYALVFVGFLLALAVLGIDLTQVTIMISALGVGIGFGLQQIVNNWVSGILLLVERPIRVGDYIEHGGQWAEVKSIGLRATRVLTFDRADIWIPNGDLITRDVINWTFSDRFARLKLPVRVAFGSDTAQVLDILMEVANADPAVVQYPAPYAFFNGYGEGSLNFELRIYLLDSDVWFTVWGRLYQEIERKLREAGIEVPFPQRDLHVRSVDQPMPPTEGPSPEEKHLRMVEQEDEKKEEEEYHPPDL